MNTITLLRLHFSQCVRVCAVAVLSKSDKLVDQETWQRQKKNKRLHSDTKQCQPLIIVDSKDTFRSPRQSFWSHFASNLRTSGETLSYGISDRPRTKMREPFKPHSMPPSMQKAWTEPYSLLHRLSRKELLERNLKINHGRWQHKHIFIAVCYNMQWEKGRSRSQRKVSHISQ